MRISFRIVLICAIALTISGTYFVLPILNQVILKWSLRDLKQEGDLILSTAKEALVSAFEKPDKSDFFKLLYGFTADDKIYGAAFCDHNSQMFRTSRFPSELSCKSLLQLALDGPPSVWNTSNGKFYIIRTTLGDKGREVGKLLFVLDPLIIENRVKDLQKHIIYFIIFSALLASLLTTMVVNWGVRRWVNSLKMMVKKRDFLRPFLPHQTPELRPVISELRDLVTELNPSNLAKDESQMTWSAKKLKDILQRDLMGEEIIIVSNREPYIHVWKDHHVEVQLPASGVVTALEPIMRACSGTWIAHGSGSADKEVVDRRDHIRVPPDRPSYQLRRVWLTEEEEKGYYYGFSNEGLWPLCHIAHARPEFRAEDWEMYQEVNAKFAEVTLEEVKTSDPIILVQDYHFALLPEMIKKALPRSTVVTFWHIPWPNPEAFGICPWREELLKGLLGSDILGFHTRFHCNNFLGTVDRYLESRIDHETSRIIHNKKETTVNPYPISVESPPRYGKKTVSVPEAKKIVCKRFGLPETQFLGIGVDRLDYTKGIVERFLAVEKFLELHPYWVGKFSFIQIGSPSRSIIERYKQFNAQVDETVDRINTRFQRGEYKPIIFIKEHHEPERVFEYLKAADLCMVTSLHDGMNLVAKEYVSAKDNERGVLILSQFTGSSKELFEALIVNPYDIVQCAEAINVALEMSAEEQRGRMHNMRKVIEEFNVYRWAGRMLLDASRTRQRNRFLKKFSSSLSVVENVNI